MHLITEKGTIMLNLTNKKNYIESGAYQKDLDAFCNAEKIKTGMPWFDDKLKIRKGVYLLGGLPSVGKTSLFLQLSDQIAEYGTPVLFFSLEQNECDLTNKSLNRIMNKYSTSREYAFARCLSYVDKISTVTATGIVTIEDICDEIKSYLNNEVKPVIFIDYLQLIHSTKNLSKREEIEYVSQQIINLSKQYELTIFVLSSLNRANYMSPIDFESFKESGSLEYDADVVLGLQYQILSNESFLGMSSSDKKRLLLAKEKSKETRSLEITCLKNRFGPILDNCKLNYTPSKDLFEENEQKPQPTNKKSVKVL